MVCGKAGTWTSNWGHINGLKKSNYSSFSDCDDLHVGRRVFRKGKKDRNLSVSFMWGCKVFNPFACFLKIWQEVPKFISWIRYISFNYHTYKLLLKVQYGGGLSRKINGMRIDDGWTEVCALIAMVFGYRLLAYLSLRRMKLPCGA